MGWAGSNQATLNQNPTMTPENLKKWKVPSDWFGQPWHGYYVFLGQTRNSGALDRANFDAGWKAIQAVASKESVLGDEDESATVVKVCENHWACGWIEWIAIHESDEAALKVADEIAGTLTDYPVVDESLFSQYETDEANDVWKSCYRVKDRVKYIRAHPSQFEFRDYSDLIGCVRGNYFAGYASELLN